MTTFYFADKESGERLGEIEPHVADCIVAVKKGEASPEEEPHFSLTQKMRRDGLMIECGCRPDLQSGPLLGPRRKGAEADIPRQPARAGRGSCRGLRVSRGAAADADHRSQRRLQALVPRGCRPRRH